MINFIGSGLIGDFIQCLFAVKQICEIKNVKANLYITDDPKFGGDKFKYPLNYVFEDLEPVILQQDYINSFEIYNNQTNELLNLNNFRRSPYLFRKNWTENLQSIFNFNYVPPYQWVSIKEKNNNFDNKILLHRSLKTMRHDPNFPFNNIIQKYRDDLIFISNEPKEYEIFPFKSDIPYHKVNSLYELYVAINSCKFFIGNQSSPYTLASSLDVLRVLELNNSIDRFASIGEEKYSSKIMDVSQIL